MERNYSYSDPNLVFVVGYGNLPSNCALRDDYSMIALSLLIDTKTNIILDVAVNTINDLSAKFISSQIIGKDIIEEKNDVINSLKRYQAPAQKPLIVAFKASIDRYLNYLNEISGKK